MEKSSAETQNFSEVNRFFERSFDMLCIIGANGRFKRVNPAFEKTVGWPPEKLLDKPFLDYVHTDDLPVTQSAIDKFLQGVTAATVENRFKCRDGAWCWLVWNIQSDPNGELYATAREVVGPSQIADVHPESELRIRAIIDSALDAVVGMDAGGRIIEWNARAEEIFGWTHQEAVGKKMSQVIIPAQYREAHEQGLKHFLSTGEGPVLNKRIEITGLHRKGYEFPVELTVMPVKWGNTYSFNAFLRDISARKQMETQIEESLAHRIRQVETSTQVAQEIAAAPALDELFRQVVNLVKERFGYYYAHIYTVEAEALVMQEGTGEPGRQMKAAGHKIALNAEKSLVARAARTQEAVLSPDVTLTPDWLPNPLLPDTKSELAVPIKLQEKVLGVLDVQGNTVGSLDDEDHLLLTGLCGQIAVAMNNRLADDKRNKAEAQLRRRSRQYAVLNEINLAVLAQSNPQAVYQMVSQSLVDHFDMVFARIWLLDETGNELVLQVSAGAYTHLTGSHSRVPLDSNQKLARIAGGRKPYVSNDLLTDPLIDDPDWVKQSKMAAFAGYPLMAENELLGLLGMFSRQPIDAETQPLLQSLAVLVSTTTTTHRLLAQLTTRARDLQTVAEVSVQAATVLETSQLLQSVVDLTQERFGLYHAHIYLLDEAGQMLTLAAGAGKIGRQMVAKGWQIPFDREQSLVARAARSRQGVIVNNVRRSANWMPNPLLPDTRSELAVPMIVGDKLLGVLDVQADETDHFTREDVLTKTILAAQVSVALQNARSFEREEKAVKELNILTRRLTQEGWEAYHQTYPESETGFVYDLQQVTPLAQTVEEENGSDNDAKIEHPLRVRNETIGHLALSQPQRLTGDAADIVNVVANRLSTHIENLRLSAQNEIALVEARRSQQMLQSVIDSIPDWIFIKDRDHSYQLVNKSYAQSFALLPEEIVGKNALELGLPEDVVKGNPEKGITGFWPQDLEAMNSGETKITESEPGEIDGRQVYLNTVRVPLKDNQGQVWAMLGVVRDVTERERLLEDVQRLAAIVENHPDFIGVGALDGKARYVNPAGLQLMGLPPNYDVTTMDAAKFYLPEDAERLLQEGIPTALEKGFWAEEATMLRADGATIPVEQTIGINYDEQGRPTGFSITMRDITERKESEIERERLLTEVEAAYRQYVRQEWAQYLGEQHRGQWQIEYQKPEARADLAGPNENEDAPALNMPISLRGQDIGSFILQDIDSNRAWTAEELALVETVTQQLALTIENLRLFGNTRQRADREKIIADATQRIWASGQLERVMQTAAEQLGTKLNASKVVIRLGSRDKLLSKNR